MTSLTNRPGSQPKVCKVLRRSAVERSSQSETSGSSLRVLSRRGGTAPERRLRFIQRIISARVFNARVLLIGLVQTFHVWRPSSRGFAAKSKTVNENRHELQSARVSKQ